MQAVTNPNCRIVVIMSLKVEIALIKHKKMTPKTCIIKSLAQGKMTWYNLLV